MGKIVKPQPVKLICGILAATGSWLDRSREILAREFGPLDQESEIIPFDFTSYYEKELGPEILRRYVSFATLIDAGDLASIKLATNRLEEELSEDGVRKVNLDPGWLDLSKMVLATTKDATYRVYLGEGIYAQATLFYEKGSYRPWEWTYADYRTETAIGFFNEVRRVYRLKLKSDDGKRK